MEKPEVLHICLCMLALVALLIHETFMRHIVSSFVASLALEYYATLYHKRHDFLKKVTEDNFLFFVLFTTLSKMFLF